VLGNPLGVASIPMETVITPIEARELQHLYEKLINAAAAAAEAVSIVSVAPKDPTLERFGRLHARAMDIVARIKEIVDQG
jgi:hypothetical protein